MKELKTKKLLARDLVNAIREGLINAERQDRQGRRGQPKHFYGRDAGGCQLRVYLGRLGFPEEEPSRFRFVDLARRGRDLEHLVLDALRAGGIKLSSSQERCSKSYRAGDCKATVVGRCDALIERTGGVEVKSISAEEFSELRSRQDLEGRRLSHINQCLIYCWLFNLPSFFLLYVSRNDAKYRCFEIKRDKKREKQLLEELCETEEKIQKKDPPNPKVSLSCYFCPFREFCPAFGGDPEINPTDEKGLPPCDSPEVREGTEEERGDSPPRREPMEQCTGEPSPTS